MSETQTESPFDALIQVARVDLGDADAAAQRAHAEAATAKAAAIEAESRAKQSRHEAKRAQDVAKEMAKQQQKQRKRLDDLLQQQARQVQADLKSAGELAKAEADAQKNPREDEDKRARKIRAEAEKARKQAERFKEDEKATAGLLDKASARLGDEDEKGPLKDVLEDLQTLIRLIRAYSNGSYREVPWDTVALAIGAVVYLVNPVDLIPDVIPVLGLADDAAVIAFVVNKVRDDLEDFRRWERRNAG